MGRFPLWAALAVVSLASGAPAGASLIGTSQEVKIGQQVARQLERKYGLVPTGAVTERVAGIGRRVAAVADRPKLKYRYRVLADKQVNAVACPGGFIYAFRGLTDRMTQDDELAAVLAHETAHVTERHGMEGLERALGLQLLLALVTGGDSSDLGNVAMNLLLRGYSRSQEEEADRVGHLYLFKAGYPVEAMARMLSTLHEATGGGGGGLEWLSTHPSDRSRVGEARKREGAILLELGSTRPAANPPRLGIAYQMAGQGEREAEVGEALAQQVADLLTGSAQFRAEYLGTRTPETGKEAEELGAIASERTLDGAIGLSLTKPPLVAAGEGRKADVTLQLAVQMQVVPAGADQAELVHSVTTDTRKHEADQEKKIRESLGKLTGEAARAIALAILRPPASGGA